MHLTQLHLRNWRSYRNATFVFPTPDRSSKRNVILVGAQNGVGKTSFLIALYLGLFGREAMPLVEGFRGSLGLDDRLLSYQKLIESILHRPAKSEDEPHCLVSLGFHVDGGPVSIQRRWLFRKGGKVHNLDSSDGEEVLIEANGRKKLYTTWQEANARIEELLFPVNVMPCLFFDGEQAQERVEAASGRALFEAVKTLYGTGILGQLSESLRTYISNEKNALVRDVGSVRVDELERKRSELDAKKDQLKSIQEGLGTARKTRASIEERRQSIEASLYSLVGDKAADVEEYSKAVVALQEEESRLRQELVTQVGSIALPLAVGRTSRRISELLNSELIREKWLVLKHEASSKAGLIVDDVFPSDGPRDVVPSLMPAQTMQLRGSLEKALERLWTPAPDGCAAEYYFTFLSASERQGVLTKLERAAAGSASRLSDIALNLQSVSTRLAETRARFERTRDIQPQLAKLKEDLQHTLDRYRETAAEVAGLENRERTLLQEITDLRAAIGQMEGRQEALNPIQAKLEVAQRLRAVLDDAQEYLIPLCKDALETRCTLHFRKMISGEYGGFRARFETESEPWLEGPRGQQVLVSTMSGAQKRAFGLAFTLAVADVAGREAPIVIDTPVGNMDSEYRSRVLQYVAEAAPGQVIYLSHDEEIYGQYVTRLKNSLLQQNLVSFVSVEDGAGVSTVQKDRYF